MPLYSGAVRGPWLRVLAIILAWSSIVGLIRLIAIYFASVAAWWAADQRWLAAGALPFGIASWWLLRRHDAAERRRMSAPRTIPKSKRDSLGAALVRVEPQDVLLVHHGADAEAGHFATDLMIALHNSAHWTAHPATVEADHGVTGLRVEVSKQATASQKASAKALVKALGKLGFKAEPLRTMPEHVQPPFLNRKKHPVPIMLTIGTR